MLWASVSLPTLPSSGYRFQSIRSRHALLSLPIHTVVTELSRAPTHIQRRTGSSHDAQNRRRALRRVHARILRMQKHGNQKQRPEKNGAGKNLHTKRGRVAVPKWDAANWSKHSSQPPLRQSNSTDPHPPRYPAGVRFPKVKVQAIARIKRPVISTGADGFIVRGVERPLYLELPTLGAPSSRAVSSRAKVGIARSAIFLTLALSPSSSASTPPSPHDDTSGKASLDYPDRTRPRPPPPEEYGPHPTRNGAPSGYALPTSPAPRLLLGPGSASAPGRPSLYPARTPSTRPHLAETPGRADIRGRTSAATGVRNNPNRTSADASPGSPSGTTGKAAAHSAPAEAPRTPPRPHPPACVRVFSLRAFSLHQRSRATAPLR